VSLAAAAINASFATRLLWKAARAAIGAEIGFALGLAAYAVLWRTNPWKRKALVEVTEVTEVRNP
jgi:hypothetical protein